MSYTVKLRRNSAKGAVCGTFGPFATQQLAVKQGEALADQTAKGIVVTVEPSKPTANRKRRNASTAGWHLVQPGLWRHDSGLVASRVTIPRWEGSGPRAPRGPGWYVYNEQRGTRIGFVKTLSAAKRKATGRASGHRRNEGKRQNYRRLKTPPGKWVTHKAELGTIHVMACPVHPGMYLQIVKGAQGFTLYRTDDHGSGPSLGTFATVKAAKAAAGRAVKQAANPPGYRAVEPAGQPPVGAAYNPRR